MIGLVLMLANLDDPAKIGPAMAVCLLTVLYGTILKYFIYAPILHRIEARITESHKDKLMQTLRKPLVRKNNDRGVNRAGR